MNALDIVNEIAAEQVISRKKQKDGDNYLEIPEFGPGDTLNVAVRVVEGEKERIQYFKGIVIGVRGSAINKTFLIRKVSSGIGVERIFPVYSPMIQSIEVIRRGNVRRAKLYYLRGMSEKKIRQKLS